LTASPPVFLALDLGNSSAKVGLFGAGALPEADPVCTFSLKSLSAAKLETALSRVDVSPDAIDAAGLCSVVPKQTVRATEAVEAVCGVTPVAVRADVPLPIGMAYETPHTLGADRIAAAAAAHVLYGRDDAGLARPTLVIDAGTAVTVEVVDAAGTYLGGAILPGLRLQRSALARGTAQLPTVPPVAPPSAIGTSTTTALQAGIVLGLIGALDGLLARATDELDREQRTGDLVATGVPVVIATGGSAPLLMRHLDRIDVLAPHLVLQGVRLLTAPSS
ncbi:MAG: type III pantothenate kinase, partial [Bacteroidota bacterium]